MLLNQFGAESNRSAKKAVGTAKSGRFAGESQGVAGDSAGCECEGRDGFLGRFVIGGVATVRAAGAAFLGAGTKGLFDDGLDGTRAAAALGTAAKAAVNLLGVPRQVRRCTDGITNIVVAQDVAGTDNHETVEPWCDASSSIFKSAPRCKRKSRNFKQFQTDAGEILE